MKRITNYALNCLIEQGISKEHIKSLVKAIENQTRDNILTPEQAIEILLDGVIYEEELHQQTVLDSNTYNSGRTKAYEFMSKLAAKTEADLKNYITDTAYRCIKNSSNIGKYHLYIRLPIWTDITEADIYIILCRIPVDSQIFLCKVSMLIYVEKILTVYLH